MVGDVVLYHEFPPETSATVSAFGDRVETALDGVRLVRTSDYADAVESIRDAEVIVEHGMSNDLLAEASSLEWVQSLSAGVNRYDLTPLERRDVLLTTVSGAHAQPAAEHVLGLLLFFERGVDRARRQQRDSVWRRFPASELASKTVGIVGVGQIGGRVAEVVSALGSEVVGTKRDTGTCPDAIDAVYPPDRLHTVLGQSDYLVLACPLTDETEQLIGETELSSMHNDAVLVNVARGEVVDQEALVSALKEGYLGGAALDVTAPEPLPGESPLWDMDDVVITPHMAGGSPEFARRCADVFVSNFQRYREGEYDAMRNRVL